MSLIDQNVSSLLPNIKQKNKYIRMMDRGNSTQGGALLVINEGISDTYSVHVNTIDLTMLKGHSIKKNLYL